MFSESFNVGSDGVIRSVERKRLLTTEKKQIRAIMKEVKSDEFFYSTRFPIQIRAGAGSSVLVESGNVLPIKVLIYLVFLLMLNEFCLMWWFGEFMCRFTRIRRLGRY